MMNDSNKEQTGRDMVCKNHSARSDRAELYRICPSKLSKRELEDLYFALLENNLDLKKTINGQQDKIKLLTTKVARMTASQKNTMAKEQKDCCASTKAVVTEQRESIADLKKANERMAERIRQLNMRLCSAKQFLKRTPVFSSSIRCMGCSTSPYQSTKNLSASAINFKTSKNNLKNAAVSCDCVIDYAEREITTRTAETETSDQEKEVPEKLCDENKCRTLMEELKQKIVALQEELSKSHDEYTNRICKLEQEVSELHQQNIRARSDRIAEEDNLKRRDEQTDLLVGRLRNAEAQYNELSTQLLVEQKKVAELEMNMKSAAFSNQYVKIMPRRLSAVSEPSKQTVELRPVDNSSPRNTSDWDDSSPRLDIPYTTNKGISQTPETKLIPEEAKHSKSDDSGYNDTNKTQDYEDKGESKVNDDLAQRIAYLQNQLDSLKMSANEYVDPVNTTPVFLGDTKEVAGLEDKLKMKSVSNLDILTQNNNVDKDDKALNMADTLWENREIPSTSKKYVEDSKNDLRNTRTTKETSSQQLKDSNKVIYTEVKKPELPKSPSKKMDWHNSLQIPGPIPVCDVNENAKTILKCESKTSQKSGIKVTYNDDAVTDREQNNHHVPKSSSKKSLEQNTRRKSVASAVSDMIDSQNGKKPPTIHPIDKKTIFDDKTKDSLEYNVIHIRKGSMDSKIDDVIISNSQYNQILSKKEASSANVKSENSHNNINQGKSTAQNEIRDSRDRHIHAAKPEIDSSLPHDNASINKTDLVMKHSNIDKNNANATVDNVIEEHLFDTGSIKPNIVQDGEKKIHKGNTVHIVSKGNLIDDHNHEISTSSLYLQVGSAMPVGKTFIYNKDNRASEQSGDSKVLGNDKHNSVPEKENVPLVQMDICEQYTTICKCPQINRQDIAVFRTCSGTANFQCTAIDTSRFRRCQCYKKTVKEVQADIEPGQVAQCKSSTESHARTYTIQGSAELVKCSRATTPDNTDCEISSLTDLPSERDGKSSRPLLSPGEDKATTTYTDTYTHTTTDYGTLSEGELPGVSTVRRLSPGEKEIKDNLPTPKPVVESTSQKMEAALEAITEELSRCRQLLTQRSVDVRKKCDASAMTSRFPSPVELRRAPGNPQIGDASTPKCIFTLHIGTVVLSDEAVMNSRDMSLVMTWKFYDQNVAMTRMRAGRVMLFDFSTEYDVKLTDEFIDYLKYEEMPIVICELNKLHEPFASCALPLRDALLHTNRRADMSLALVAGPQMRGTRNTKDLLDASDEVGVLDLWCMLRAEPRLLAALNRAIAKSSSPSMPKHSTSHMPMEKSNSRIMEQIVEDDQSNNYRLSQDLDMTMEKTRKSSLAKTDGLKPTEIPKVPSQLQTMSGSRSELGFSFMEARNLMDRHLSSGSTNRPGSNSTVQRQKSLTTSELDHKPQCETEENWRGCMQPRQSGIIANEVPSNIKSAIDMKQALERNTQENDSLPLSRLGRSEDKNAAIKRIKEIKRSSLMPNKENVSNSFYNLLKKERKKNKGPSQKRLDVINRSMMDEEVSEPPELAQKYENITKILDSSKQADNKKSVTILPSYTEDTSTMDTRRPWNENDKEYNEETKRVSDAEYHGQTIQITVLWLALNEECEAMVNPNVQRLYVAYSFLGRGGAELETPVSLPKPKHYVDKCYFHFKRTFNLNDCDLPLLGHMAKCRSNKNPPRTNDCIIFSVISEPPEDPLGLYCCEDIGYAYLYLGDLLVYSAGSDSYTEVLPVRAARQSHMTDAVCGVLAIRVDGLDVARKCLVLTQSDKDLSVEM